MPLMPKGGLQEIRRRIDTMDNEILVLLNRRAKAARAIGRVKEELRLKFHSPGREQEILRRLKKENERLHGDFPSAAVQRVFREIMSASLSLEKPLRVAFLGPKATFTHLAAIEHFGLSTEMMAMRSIGEIFEEVEHERADYGVVPIENSTEGMVTHTLDLFVDSNLKITAEQVLEIEHHLMMRTPKPLSMIRMVVSHRHALAQCRHWLEKHLPHAAVKETESTAQAAELAREEGGVAAIASRFAADLYGLQIMRERVQDLIDNYTRFLVLGPDEIPPTGQDKTSILFSVKDEPGSLYKMLKPFADNRVNLTKIESRPRRVKLWEYVFFIDLDGHSREPRVMKAIQDLEKRCIFLKNLGSYPRATWAKKPSGRKTGKKRGKK